MSKFLNFAWEQRNKLRAEAVIIKYGPKTTIEWTEECCIVNGTEEFKYSE